MIAGIIFTKLKNYLPHYFTDSLSLAKNYILLVRLTCYGEGASTLNRAEALVLLKELVAEDLVDPSFVHISLKTPGHYQIQIKCDYNRNELMAFIKKNNLAIKEDTEQKYLVIYRPAK